MNFQETNDYLAKLLNRPIDSDSVITLTSGQRARFTAWLEKRGWLELDSTNKTLWRAFTTRQLHDSNLDGSAIPVSIASEHKTNQNIAGEAGVLAGVGIDIQRVAELIPFDDSFDFASSEEMARIFSIREIAYACGRASPTRTLAGLFAAKEAIIKAGRGGAPAEFQAIEILPDHFGAPTHAGFELSISHSGEYAIALAVRTNRVTQAAAELSVARSGLPHQPVPEQIQVAVAGRAPRLTSIILVGILMLVGFLAGVLCVNFR